MQFLKNIEIWLIDYAPMLISAALIFILGSFAAKGGRSLVRRLMEARKIEGILVTFITNLLYAVLMAFVALAALEKIGVKTTSFVAVIGAAGLAIGLAFQNSLSNFASGFLLVLFQPFKKGNFIEAGGMNEKVKLTFDAEGISIPYPTRDIHVHQTEAQQVS